MYIQGRLIKLIILIYIGGFPSILKISKNIILYWLKEPKPNTQYYISMIIQWVLDLNLMELSIYGRSSIGPVV